MKKTLVIGIVGLLILSLNSCSLPVGSHQEKNVRQVDNTSLAYSDSTGAPATMAVTKSMPKEMADEITTEDSSDIDVAPEEKFNTERYDHIQENPFLASQQNPLSTFSIDVDTASYSNMRRFLNQGNLPPKDSVRIEELVNYFSYDYPNPEGELPFSTVTEIAPCPWKKENLLLHIGIQGDRMVPSEVPPCNLVFLMDVSGSMSSANKLPLLKTGLGMLVNQMRKQDRVAIVVYAGAAGLVLPATPGNQKDTIMSALGRLQSGGSTNGGAGIELAYKVAQENFRPGGINRIILATDGDFNIGTNDQGSLIRLIEEKRETGVFLTILGLGMWNLNDSMMEQLADKGNGNYAYIDTIAEAKKVLVDELSSTLVPIAKDVKIQIEFNPRYVDSYRLIGYENRLLRAEDFNDDKKDAGEIGAGHTVTALYEIVPTGGNSTARGVDPLKYQESQSLSESSFGDELLTLKIRYKEPQESTSKLISTVITREQIHENTSSSFRFSASVASFGMLLRGSKYKGLADMDMVKNLAKGASGDDSFGYRREFVQLVEAAQALQMMTK